MRRTTLWIIGGGLLAALLVWSIRPQSMASEPSLPVPRMAHPELQGVGSCAAAACHNANGPKGSKGSEYTTWASLDPHARAYEVLFNERSIRMVKNLRREDSAKPPHQDTLCLSCHVQPNYGELAQSDKFAPSDGVGCEACHGAAEGWRTTHYLWGAAKPAAEKQALGLNDTKNLRHRAEVCVGCHVGRGTMDVNHDLIASGHPRLRFEFGAYLANYPKHWHEDKECHPDFEERAWAVGQVVSARAALELLHERTRNDRPWPEFAEYNCFACHKGLDGKSTGKSVAGPVGKPGELPWGTWYYAMQPTMAERLPLERRDAFTADFTKLRSLMQKRPPDRGAAAQLARQLSNRLSPLADELNQATYDRGYVKSLLAGLSEKDNLLLSNWDGATQLYLGLAAATQSLGDLAPNDPGLAELRKAVQDLGGTLKTSFPTERATIYESPSGFPPPTLQEKLRAIRDRVK